MSDRVVKLSNGLEMPIIGLGTSLRGKATKCESNDFVESVKHAISQGYRHIDTAKAYNNEHLVGKAIKEASVKREELFVVTKLYPEDMGYDKTVKAFEKSCKQLQVDYVDLYLIHFPGLPLGGKKAQLTEEDAKKQRIETWKALEKLYDEGKCKAIGVSNFLKRHLDDLLNEPSLKIRPMINQCEFHPYYNNKELFDQCRELNIQFEGYSPLGKMNVLTDPLILDLAKKYGKTPAQIAIRWSIQNNIVTIPGSTNHQRIEDNFNVFDFKLDDEDMTKLWTLNKNEKVSWDPTNVV